MKKRKFSEITKNSQKLIVKKPEHLPCTICNNLVYNYERCGKDIYCSRDCYEVLELSKKNDYLDMKRSKSFEDLMQIEK